MTTKSKLTELTEQKVAKQLTTMSRESIKWLRERVSELKDASRRIPSQISKEEERYIKFFGKGKMYFFYYDPKTKEDLPYYDRFPLVLVLESSINSRGDCTLLAAFTTKINGASDNMATGVKLFNAS